jgi:predicted ATPase
VDWALEAVEKYDERYMEAEIYRLKGELLRMRGAPENEVENYFQRAIDISRRRLAKSWELRATVSLSRLWQSQGKREEARQILQEIYSWFTEGFTTPDLLEAKALLEDLS